MAQQAAGQRNFYPRSPCGERQCFKRRTRRCCDFYPRSPCGERLTCNIVLSNILLFLSTLSLRRATFNELVLPDGMDISIHALLAESDATRRSLPRVWRNFYPRSPCGERQIFAPSRKYLSSISIHALLAESDPSNLASLR